MGYLESWNGTRLAFSGLVGYILAVGCLDFVSDGFGTGGVHAWFYFVGRKEGCGGSRHAMNFGAGPNSSSHPPALIIICDQSQSEFIMGRIEFYSSIG